MMIKRTASREKEMKMHKFFVATLPLRAYFVGMARIKEFNPRLELQNILLGGSIFLV